MVILIPCLVSQEFVSTGLGLHKSMEMSSSTLSQTLSGVFLDWDTREVLHPHPVMQQRVETKDSANIRASRALLGAFLTINILQLLVAIALRYLYRQQEKRPDAQRNSYEPLAMSPMSSPMATLHHFMPTSTNRDGSDVFLIDSSNPRKSMSPSDVQRSQFEDAELNEELAGTDMPDGPAGGHLVAAGGRWCLGFVVGYIGLVWTVFWGAMIFNLFKEA